MLKCNRCDNCVITIPPTKVKSSGCTSGNEKFNELCPKPKLFK